MPVTADQSEQIGVFQDGGRIKPHSSVSSCLKVIVPSQTETGAVVISQT